MPDLRLLSHFAREIFSRQRPQRIPEPVLLMDDPAQVEAFARAGREDGVIGQIYLLHSVQLCGLIRPGDRVIDLACGPATQLAQVARLNPQASFLGIDLAPAMLADARRHIAAQGLANVELAAGDMTDLRGIADASADVVMSTFALHHLPDTAALARCFGEIRRVLKPGGRVYLADFGRLRRDATMRFMSHRFADLQGPLFTTDFHNSLRAAFSLEDYRAAFPTLGPGLRLIPSPLAPFMVIIRSPAVQRVPQSARAEMRRLWQALPRFQRMDFEELRHAYKTRLHFIPGIR
ncbi:class I SAM-dependent methyltransferase [Viridibacterium curvum]|uniref:Methyltransferase domain-containing protein n=1 Tax=Viridibacterium curvum TaxID=1101404 RepID=A0ABP9R930_9RHOO